MKTIRIFMAVMTLVLAVAVGSAKAQTLTTLYSFCATTNLEDICTDGSQPGHLIHGTDGNFYGATSASGTNDFGTIFKMTPAGTLTTLHEFSGTTGVADGSSPLLSLESGGLFYGTTITGGTNHSGAIFTITSAGTFTLLHQFSGTNGVADGSFPEILLPSGSSFIGSTVEGGTNNAGTIYTITAGGALTTIHEFGGTNGVDDSLLPILTFADGANFIGTVFNGIPGETLSTGTVFRITAGGTFATIHAFAGAEGTEPIVTAKSGANYIGTTQDGGSNGVGSAFEMTSAGTVTTFYQFSGTNGVMDGSSPGLEPITDSAGAFYGATSDGGTNAAGLAFTLSTSGTLTHVYEFCSLANCADGSSPNGAISSGGDLFGTTDGGGENGDGGTVFEFVPSGGIGGGGCTFTLTPTVVKVTDKGGKKSISVKAVGTDCTWTAVSNDSFITITAGTNGTGNGKVSFTVPGNTNTTALVGTLTIAGESVTVTQAIGGCTFRLSPKNTKLLAKGGAKTVHVTPNLSDCAWTAVSNDGFITITSGSTNILGKGTVSFNVGTNETSNILTGSMTIAGQTYTVIQAGARP